MKTVHLVLLAVVLKAGEVDSNRHYHFVCITSIIVKIVPLISCCTGVAQYQWACTEPDTAGRRYVPSARERNVDTATTNIQTR